MSGNDQQERSGARAAVETAHEAALRLLERRPRTVSELNALLLERDHPAEAVGEALRRLADAGYLDDGDLALHFILARAPRLGHGPERLLRELEQRGVDPATAREAWRRALLEGGLREEELVREAVRRRVARQPGALDRRAYRRVYNALRRAGFGAHAIRAELDPLAQFDARAEDGMDDDLA
jgi:regulatory protein